MSRAYSKRTARIGLVSAFVFVTAILVGGRPALAERMPSLTSVLQNYSLASADAGADEVKQLTISGVLAGSGLNGTFVTWRGNDRERTDEHLGPRDEKTLRVGARFWYDDANGNARELTGSLARRARTEHFIDSGDFALRPDRCLLRGRSVIAQRPMYVLDVAADGGESETLYLDARTWLPARIAYEEDDGRATVDFGDWRTVAGHRFPFRSVVSDGDHAYDTQQITSAIDVGTPVDPLTFAPFVARAIEMSAPETVALVAHDGHLYAPVTIAGHTYQFLVDTGAQSILLDRSVATELGLATSGTFEASGAERTGGLQLAKIPELHVGKRGRLTNIVVTTLDLAGSSAGAFRADGILGYPFFAASLVKIDFAAHTMTFSAPGGFASAGEALALDVDRGLPEVSLWVSGMLRAPFVIDTGNAAQLLLYSPFERRHRGLVPYSAAQHKNYGIGGATPSYRSVLDRLDFGSISLYHVDTDVMLATRGAFADRFDAGNVGLGVLQNFVMTFDEPHATIFIERGSAFDDGHARN